MLFHLISWWLHLHSLSCYRPSEQLSSSASLFLRKQKTVFLNIGKRSPASLFGGFDTATVIDTEGSVTVITKTISDSPTSEIKCHFLPNREKAVKAANCKDSDIALSQSGRLRIFLESAQ